MSTPIDPQHEPGARPRNRAGRMGRASRRTPLAAQRDDRARSRSAATRAPWWGWLILFVAAFALLPVVADSGYIRRVAFDTVLYMLLALGLNVVVGWGGLLDLGYVAFYGLGAYAYAMLDSDKFGVHLPTIISIPLIVVIGAVAGFLVGLPSRRLVGDYLAIVTLFFLQIFLTVTTNGDQIFGHDITGGANGILNIDPLHLFGHSLAVEHGGVFAVSYLYVALGFFAVVYAGAALRQPLAHRAGLALAARGSARRRGDGDAGQPPQADGVQLRRGRRGAVGNLLRLPERKRLPAHVLVPAADHRLHDGDSRRPGQPRRRHDRRGNRQRAARVAARRRVTRASSSTSSACSRSPSRSGVPQARGAARAHDRIRVRGAFIADAIHHDWVAGPSASGFDRVLSHWVIIPITLATWVGPVTYISLICLALALTLVRGWVRYVLLVPTLYLGTFVWENVLLAQPESTRYIVLGVMLIALMITRPNGLFGERRVEIV